jgi:hypothetical protein
LNASVNSRIIPGCSPKFQSGAYARQCNNQSIMIIVFALTQFVFLTLGTIFLKGMVNANGDITSSSYFQFLDQNWIWFFLLPVAWTAYALVSYNVNKGPFTPAVARILGIALSGFCLLFFASVMFFPSA